MSPRTSEEILQTQAEFFQGPIPDPQTLQAYQQVDPNFPDRILKMAENQSVHRQKQERSYLRGLIRTRSLGLVLAFLSVIAICTVGAYAIKLGHAKEGASLIGTVVVGLAGTFIWGHKKEQAAT